MLLVGLTGGIGSGKSAVAARLHRRGAVIIDADELARAAVAVGSPGFDGLMERFGTLVLREDGSLDRDVMADLVFDDPEARRALEEIVHPEVARLFAQAVAPYRSTDSIVVYVVPLLVENHLESGFDVVVVVTAPEDARVVRLSRDRAMAEGAIRRRMGAQVSDEERQGVADVIVPNGGTLAQLDAEVDRLWDSLERRRAGGPPGG